MRLWLIEHFRILPTDERYKELTINQIEVLFVSFLMSPEDTDYKESYRRGMSNKQLVESMPKDLMKNMGYSEEEIEKIGNEIALRGS